MTPCRRQVGASLRRPQRSPQGYASFPSQAIARNPTVVDFGALSTLGDELMRGWGGLDFMAPWRVVRWQPDSLSFLPLSDKVVGAGTGGR